ncbi:hypothetical protein BKI52_23375 [marine bacterium AO1-C]|nr:hypothetical protein BKI52_23375 [marine bacterium AO1-C]
MKKLLILLIIISLTWRYIIPPLVFADLKFDTVDRPIKRKSRYPYVHKPGYYFLKTLNRRYWGGAKVFFKRLKPVLARYESSLLTPRLKVTIKFEVDCSSQLTRLIVQNAPNDEFVEDVQRFLTSAKFRWLKCRSPYADKFEFGVLLRANSYAHD